MEKPFNLQIKKNPAKMNPSFWVDLHEKYIHSLIYVHFNWNNACFRLRANASWAVRG